MGLDLDDSPHLVTILPSHQIAAGVGLQTDDVTPQVAETMGQDSGTNQGLQTHITHSHVPVALALGIALPESLHGYGSGSLSKEPSPVNPSPDASLQDKNLSRQYSIPLLLQKQIMSILQEHLRVTQLIVGLAQDHSTYS